MCVVADGYVWGMADCSGRLSELLTPDRVVLPLQAAAKRAVGLAVAIPDALRKRLIDCRTPDEFHHTSTQAAAQ